MVKISVKQIWYSCKIAIPNPGMKLRPTCTESARELLWPLCVYSCVTSVQLGNVADDTISKCRETPIVVMSNNRKLLIEKTDTTLKNNLYEDSNQ